MNAMITAAFTHARTTLLVFLFVLIAGASSYVTIPKESDPDVKIPIIIVSVGYEGISPEDGERLLIKPLEKALRGLDGLKEMDAVAAVGTVSVTLTFEAGFDADNALRKVRQKVDDARPEMPSESDEPVVQEINVALFPVITVALSGQVDPLALRKMARDLKDRIEAVSGVLEVDIGGDREEMVEILVDPVLLETLNISFAEVVQLVTRNNRLVPAGVIDTGLGRMSIKAPGLVEGVADLLAMPVKVSGDTVVTFDQVATVRRTLKDPEGFARMDGNPTLTLEVKKRLGANILDMVAEVKQVVKQTQQGWTLPVTVGFSNDQSTRIQDMLGDLENNVLAAIVLVMIVVVGALGGRAAVLVGLAIPGAFLAAILALDLLGVTINIVVLFSLILVVGMLVDGAIVVVEQAQQRRGWGEPGLLAFQNAAKRMAWPVISSTVTTLAVFMPLMFWPGVIGQFMKYLPMTVLLALSASLAMALIFMPVLGGLVSHRAPSPDNQGGWGGRLYGRLLATLLPHPGKVLLVALLFMVGAFVLYGQVGKGVEFFPDVEPDFAQIIIHGRGDLSIHEKDEVVQQVENQLLGYGELKVVYGRSFAHGGGAGRAEDTIGVIQLEFVDWDQRRPANRILDEIRQRLQGVAGVEIEVRKQEDGPGGGKPVQLKVVANEGAAPEAAVEQIRQAMTGMGGFVDMEDDRAPPGVEWRVLVNRAEAARFGADVATVGSAVQLVTSGVLMGNYRPSDADDEVDIRLRFPESFRHLDLLNSLRTPTQRGSVPLSNFVQVVAAPKVESIKRSGGSRVVTISADVAEGLLVDTQVTQLKKRLASMELGKGIDVTFKGEDEDQQETMAFLSKAFVVAIFLMFLVLVTQFNSLFQAVLVLSAIIFSTAGVLLGLLVSGEPFGIVMGGIGIIALGGIVVNNNIVLIDCYNGLRAEGHNALEAAKMAGEQRLRPVLLTAGTTILGLMPMALGVNLDLMGREILIGSPSTQWWIQLSTTIAGGLTFATPLTLLLTPCLLVGWVALAARIHRVWGGKRGHGAV
ncbi:acriflavin resistance protein [Magnetococcus marinus MC-1]|uniref:Acriflavin resistance protein n=1 Tax=Magnetococcus marinus (strain ATCC BAA-1437 / JCM 17883 / MC-1) TaxID=156889 RepID=A0LAL7_MAGMM|nr:efflux RND transporter permease subunit [Magnetococcus marinus]ABK45010.1 acriflavin resistance protein [Magnetococcus marinus MC-1]